METTNQPAGETAQATPKPESKRVVLNMSQQLAEHLSVYLLSQDGLSEDLKGIAQRIKKTISKHNENANNDKGSI